MNKLQHTPGPWKYQTTSATDNKLDIIITPDSSKNIGAIGWTYNRDESSIPNARLIAAAPEMLIELLKSIAELDKTGFASITSETIIMKATGWSYDILNDVLTKLSTGMSIDEILK